MVRIIQNYTLYEIIGQGAYGKVYRAVNKNDNKEYAVKVIEVRRFKENKKLEECTVNQINILTNIDQNDHIIRYIDMLKTPNNFYFVYQYCNGGTLEGLLKKEGMLPQKQALLIFKELIQAFQVLNKYNIMHRDLKPDNIFFNNGIVKLGDFGFCKSLDKANMTKTMLGSPIYMAPEILRGEVYSTKADIWSLGVVLYQMLYGFCPFESTTIPKLLELLKQMDLEFPNGVEVSQETKSYIRRLLTKDPTRRIEWMELLQTKITPDGKLSTKKDKLSLAENSIFAAKSVSANGEENFTSNSSSSSVKNHNLSQHSESKQSGSNPSTPFFKKKTAASSYEHCKKGKQGSNGVSLDEQSKQRMVKQHSQAVRLLQLAVDILKSGDPNCALFSYLLLKKAQEKVIALRDEVGNNPELKEVMKTFNLELKEINTELMKYTYNDNVGTWKPLLKNAGESRRSRFFYEMVCYLSNDTPKQDISHQAMLVQIKSKLQE